MAEIIGCFGNVFRVQYSGKGLRMPVVAVPKTVTQRHLGLLYRLKRKAADLKKHQARVQAEANKLEEALIIAVRDDGAEVDEGRWEGEPQEKCTGKHPSWKTVVQRELGEDMIKQVQKETPKDYKWIFEVRPTI